MGHTPHSYLRGDLVIVIDVASLDRAAEFWSGALGYVREGEGGGRYLSLVPADGAGAEILLQRVADVKQGKNRVHLDLRTRDLDAEISRRHRAGCTGGQRRAGDRIGLALVCAGRPGRERVLRPAAASLVLAGLASWSSRRARPGAG